jgi:hypothetical protein
VRPLGAAPPMRMPGTTRCSATSPHDARWGGAGPEDTSFAEIDFFPSRQARATSIFSAPC